MLSRRSLLTAGTAAVTILPLSLPGAAQTIDDQFDPVKEWGFVPSVEEAVTTEAVAAETGTAPSRSEEVSTAFGLLYGAPREVEPIEIAQYFAGLAAKNRDGHLYNQEWPVRANPLIVGFFSMTNTLPSEGDQTAWCAAFLNFCLVAAKKPITMSAMSGSFRKYGKETESPKIGDIVVFAKANMPPGNLNGHVGFYLGENAEGIEVLGGNQVGRTKTTGAITIGRYSGKGDLLLHSFRSVS